MSQSINWDLLEDQYLSDGIYREKLSKMVTIIDEAFLAGKKFAQTFTENMERDVIQPHVVIKNTERDHKVHITYNEPNKNDKCNIRDTVVKDGDTNANTDSDIPSETGARDENIQTQKQNYENNVRNIVNVADKPNTVPSQTVAGTDEKDIVGERLKKLLNDGILSESLYEKLTSNEKFELEPKDIEELNNLKEDSIKERVALKFNIGE